MGVEVAVEVAVGVVEVGVEVAVLVAAGGGEGGVKTGVVLVGVEVAVEVAVGVVEVGVEVAVLVALEKMMVPVGEVASMKKAVVPKLPPTPHSSRGRFDWSIDSPCVPVTVMVRQASSVSEPSGAR